jgi:chromate transporter
MNDSSAKDVAGVATIGERMPSFAEAFRVWLRIGLLSFGGPAGQIALLHREVVTSIWPRSLPSACFG